MQTRSPPPNSTAIKLLVTQIYDLIKTEGKLDTAVKENGLDLGSTRK